jgi:hypothetical protein
LKKGRKMKAKKIFISIIDGLMSILVVIALLIVATYISLKIKHEFELQPIENLILNVGLGFVVYRMHKLLNKS